MAERRRWLRRGVTWVALISMNGEDAAPARVVEASRHGLRVATEGPDSPLIVRGTRCEIDIRLAGGQARFVRVCEVCHWGEHGLGLFVPEALPAAVIPLLEPESRDVAVRPSSLVARLRSALSSPL
jgi:hypothetical protein